MSLGRRNARFHDTDSVRKNAFDQGSDTDYQVGQHVMTVDGIAGLISDIKDGPVSGTEIYHIVLDNNLGAGEYSPNQIKSVVANKSVQAQVISNVVTAADDYPELGNILIERPDIAINTKMGSRIFGKRSNCADCGTNMVIPDEEEEPLCNPCSSKNGGLAGLKKTFGENPKGKYGVDLGGEHYYEVFHPSGYTVRAYHKPELPYDFLDIADSNPRYDKNGNLKYEVIDNIFSTEKRPLTHEGLQKDLVNWIKENRPDVKTESSRKIACLNCGCGDPMDDHGDPKNITIDQCPSCGHRLNNNKKKSSFNKTSVDRHEMISNDPEQADPSKRRPHSGSVCPDCKYWNAKAYPGMACPLCGTPMISGNDLHNNVANQVHDPSDFEDADKDQNDDSRDDLNFDDSFGANSNDSGSENSGDSSGSGGDSSTGSLISKDIDRIIAQASTDPDFAFHVTAGWSDVRAKAKRIRQEGGVNIKLARDGYIFGNVRGDHNVYETGLQKLPGKSGVSSWSCGCKWGSYHWGAPDDNSKFAGRMCSHALALQFESQSQGMFGKDIRESEQARWVPRRVVVKHDINSGQNIRARSSLNVFEHSVSEHIASLGDEDAYYTLHAFEGSVNTPFGEVIVDVNMSQPGGTKLPDKSENPASAGFASAPDPGGWGDQSVKTRDAEGVGSVYGSLDDEFLFEADLDSEATLREEPEAALPRTDGSEGILNDEPEPALPSTDGNYTTRSTKPELASLPQKNTDGKDVGRLMAGSNTTEEEDGKFSAISPDNESLQSQGSVEDIVAQFQTTASHLDVVNARPAVGDSDIAKAAKQYLEKTSMKSFTSGEADQIIREGEQGDVRAANFDRLNLEGTHYAQVEASLSEDEELENIFL